MAKRPNFAKRRIVKTDNITYLCCSCLYFSKVIIKFRFFTVKSFYLIVQQVRYCEYVRSGVSVKSPADSIPQIVGKVPIFGQEKCTTIRPC